MSGELKKDGLFEEYYDNLNELQFYVETFEQYNKNEQIRK